MNGKYLIYAIEGELPVIVKRNFFVPYVDRGIGGGAGVRLPFFDKETDMKYIDRSKWEEHKDSFGQLKFMKPGYMLSASAKESVLASFLPTNRIHNKGEVAVFIDPLDGGNVYEVNSLERVPEFGENFLQFRETSMFSNSYLLETFRNHAGLQLSENNSKLLDSVFIQQQGETLDRKLAYFQSEDFAKKLVFSGTDIIFDSIHKLKTNHFYGTNGDMWLYYFKDVPDGKILINPRLERSPEGEVKFAYSVTSSFFQYYRITELIRGIKLYREKQWTDYLFGPKFHEFKGLDFYTRKKEEIYDPNAVDMSELEKMLG